MGTGTVNIVELNAYPKNKAMQHTIKSLTGYHLAAEDGAIGKVEEFYFDDETWTIRYLVVKTGNWLSGRKVLISPAALVKASWKNNTFPVQLTKEQIRNSPGIDTDKPVARQQELELHGHYHWQPYWGSGFYAGGGGLWNVMSEYPQIGEEIITEAGTHEKHVDDDFHLRSTHAVTGYHLHATDGEIGHVYDFIMDDQTWQIICLVIDTHNWMGGKKVLVPVTHIKEIQWDTSLIIADIPIDDIKNCTPFDKSRFVDQ